MKPLNLDNRPCSPISSNCVIWQGPDIPCIKLCSGDTVSDVVFALGTELCAIMDQLNVSSYDLSCLGINSCPPADFHALIQLLIDKICNANGVPTEQVKSSGCPDCVVSVAPCFIEGNQTTMQLVDYVQMIANRVCSILDQISIINNQITNLDNRVTVLENTPPPTFTLPSIDTGCLATYMGNLASAPIDQVLDTLLNDSTIGYCALIQATGLPAEILSAVASQCVAATDPSLAVPGDNMSTAYFGSWVNSPVTAADAITNLWISICDIRTYLESLSLTVVDTNTVNLTYDSITGVLQADVQDTGWWPLKGFEFYNTTDPDSLKRPECRRIGNVIYFRGQATIPLNNPVNNLPLQYTYKAGTDTYLNITTTAPCTGNGGVQTNNPGSVIFNYNATSGVCDSVIPVEVLPAGISLDGNAYNGWKFAFRSIDTGTASSILSSLFSVAVNPAGQLYIGLIKDAEESTVIGGSGAYDTSPLNYIISHVTSGDQVPKFLRSSGSLVNGNTASGLQNVQLDFSPTEQYPFSCNANDEDEVGGFRFGLDGIMGYISPCEDSIPTPEPCSK